MTFGTSLMHEQKRYAGEMKTLLRFIEVYCHKHHDTRRHSLCADCAELLAYAHGHLKRCPYISKPPYTKPKCKDCSTHCYQKEQRAKIREIMRFSGIYFVKRGRLDWLIRYFW